MNKSPTLIVAAVACALGSACSSPSEPSVDVSELPLAERVSADGKSLRQVAALFLNGDSVTIAVPSRVRVGSAVDAYVTTLGGGCVSVDTTVTVVDGLRGSVYPYQRVPTDLNTICTADLRYDRRAIRFVFQSAGVATLRVVGRAGSGGRLVSFERRITVE